MQDDPCSVLHTSRFYYPHVGGTERYIAAAIRSTSTFGFEHSVCTSNRRASGTVSRVGPESVHRLRCVGPSKAMYPLDPRALTRLVAGSDVVHVHDLRFALSRIIAAAKRAATPVVVSTHGLIFHTSDFEAAKRFLWRRRIAPLLSDADLILCSSRQDQAIVSGAGVEAPIELFTNPVEVEDFLGLRPSRGSLPGNRPIRLLYFGRLAPNKGIERLVPLLKGSRGRLTLSVVGAGELGYQRRLHQAFAEVGDVVSFDPDADSTALHRHIEDADCIALPSTYEGFGITLVEALASGRPIILSDIAPYREIAAETTVVFTDFAAATDLVTLVEQAIVGHEPLSARARASSYAWRSRGAELASHYRGVLGG